MQASVLRTVTPETGSAGARAVMDERRLPRDSAGRGGSVPRPLTPHPAQTTPPPPPRALAHLGLRTCEGTMLRGTGGYEIEGHVGGPADILMWEGPAGPCVALTHHTLAHEVDATHDEEREDDADDGPDGAAVGGGVVGGRLGDFCQRTDGKRWSALTTKGQVPVGEVLWALEGLAVPGKKGDPAVLGLGCHANLRTSDPLPPRPAQGALLLRL